MWKRFRHPAHPQHSFHDFKEAHRSELGPGSSPDLMCRDGGCQRATKPGDSGIEFTKIPPAAQGGRERVDTVAGRVVGARAGQQIVVYARSGPWWVQPWPDKPLIPIQSDSTWTTPTHLGFEYAALSRPWLSSAAYDGCWDVEGSLTSSHQENAVHACRPRMDCSAPRDRSQLCGLSNHIR